MASYDVPTLAETRAAVHLNLRGSSAVTASSDWETQLDQKANDTGKAIFNAGDWKWKYGDTTLVTVADQDYTTTAADFGATFQPQLYDGDKHYRVNVLRDPVEFDRLRNGYRTTGRPCWVMFQWDTTNKRWLARWVPTPDDAYTYTFIYQRRFVLMTDAEDTPLLAHWWVDYYTTEITRRMALITKGHESARYWRDESILARAAALAEEERQGWSGLTETPAENITVFEDFGGGYADNWPVESFS